jgi:AcrR family transcriptional regulator
MDKRTEKQKLILEKAQETYLEKGLFNTVMDDIADKAHITRRTLYRYFETKEELSFEVTIQILNEWNHYQLNSYKTLEGTGKEKLYQFLNMLIDYMSNKVYAMKYLGEFDYYFHDNNRPHSSKQNVSKLHEIAHVSDDLLREIIVEGQEDGSISSEIDTDLTVSTISNILWSFGLRNAIWGKTIKKETGFSGIDLIRHQVKLYIMAMENNNCY